ncbi:hypothetical protein T484DRAFT_2752486 [Baffinella frigidus]|nr:hypothetical protein T484DRAFT_2752486 [Cryptophyta sp. CCMP2293]
MRSFATSCLLLTFLISADAFIAAPLFLRPRAALPAPALRTGRAGVTRPSVGLTMKMDVAPAVVQAFPTAEQQFEVPQIAPQIVIKSSFRVA